MNTNPIATDFAAIAAAMQGTTPATGRRRADPPLPRVHCSRRGAEGVERR
jgi:hypothetical protein